MKNKLRGLLACVLSLACFLSTTPIVGFAAGEKTISISAGAVTSPDTDDLSVIAGDEIVKADETGLFYVTINGEKASEGYGEAAYDGLAEGKEDSEKSGNTYYESFTVPAVPTGYKDGAKLTVAITDDFYLHGEEYRSGNIVNLEYSPIGYKVRFDLNGGEGEIESIDAVYGTEITLPDSDSVADIKSWNTKADGSGISYEAGASVKNLSTTDGEEITLYAQWENIEVTKYTVEYYLDDTDTPDYEQSYAAGETIVLPAAPEKEGFEFAGWILGEENGTTIHLPETMPENDLKAYASWTVKEYEISYIVDGTNYVTKTAAYGSDISLTVPEDPSLEGYTFAGWYDKDGNNLYSYSTVPASDIEFTAKWLRNGNAIYMVGNKTYEAYEVKEGDDIPVPEDPEKFAHKFTGWDPAIPAAMPAEDVTFTAQFELDKEFVTIVVGGTVIAGGIIAAIAGAAITGVAVIGGIITILGVASGINKTYTVTYKVDGSVYKTYKLEAGDKITVPADPTKDGYKFAGWTPEIPDEMPKKNLTFTAEWTEIKDDSNIGTDIPSTGSAGAGIAALAALALSAAAAIIIKKKKNK